MWEIKESQETLKGKKKTFLFLTPDNLIKELICQNTLQCVSPQKRLQPGLRLGAKANLSCATDARSGCCLCPYVLLVLTPHCQGFSSHTQPPVSIQHPVNLARLALSQPVLKVLRAAEENLDLSERPLSLWDEPQEQPSSADGGKVEQS